MNCETGRRAGGRCIATLCLVLALSWFCAPVLLAGMDPALVRVDTVFDGDTCQLTDGRRVRLAGIDAPEMAHDGRPAQYYAGEAQALLLRLTRGVSLRFVGVGPERDRFDRLLGDLLLPDGTSVAARLVGEGAAFFFWFDDLPQDLAERLLSAQQRAMAAGRGAWPRLLALPRPTAPYVGNTASHRFHAPDCPDAARIGRRNRVVLPTLTEAFGRGFAPARDCTPWPVAP
ncbi:thermonuclease family protein [Desulfovibrio sp. TomC]|uniref:thermonuclease family protein n=1 Tax=Desulfovibrio sp. TomC TaxID=1562888 RepID=UPI0005758811|nr:thermonuclease family protein [Desulfovibrio sp. TomC]KHK04300.1 nuclease (SNase domain protein) [Desulfovibrio sp. TomC]